MGLRVYNTLSGRKEAFRPISDRRVSMFVCGPTVQGPVHLGHARTYLFYDVVARYLSHLGYSVDFLVNITDVDERITTAASSEKTDPESYAARYSQYFLEDMATMGISTITRVEPVSKNVGEAISQVSALIESGHAYVADGWVYFDTSTFPKFGALSHQTPDDLALRPLELSPLKRNLADFSLWRPEALVPGKWKSPWGIGSPGWHIQDTAITLGAFGARYDIHGGAYELIYPHHEAEIAQGESITGVSPMVKYWVHTHLVTTEGEKMSKSLGNVYTIREALKAHSASDIRFYFLSTHYRRDMDLSGLRSSERRLRGIRASFAAASARLGRLPPGAPSAPPPGFLDAMNDDFDTPRAIRSLERALSLAARLRDQKRAASSLAEIRLGFEILGVGLAG